MEVDLVRAKSADGRDAEAKAPVSRVTDLTERLRDAITDGRIVPGYRLVQDELCEAFGVGRGTLREALTRLEAQGWISSTLHRGAQVRVLSRQEIGETLDIREALEMVAAGLAAERLTEEKQAALVEIMAALSLAEKNADRESFLVHNNLLHEEIIAASENERLREGPELKLIKLIQVQVVDYGGTSWMAQAQSEHVAVVDGILSGKRGAAERAMRSHIRRVNELMRSLPNEAFLPINKIRKS
ncbi:MAG: GntR family transcriptional regulator [Pseudomonadota bacterium]